MPCPMQPAPGASRRFLNWIITSIAWLLADVLGWRAALAVLPPMLRKRVAIVTGANAGLGYETTKALLQQGATVVMACRSLEHAQMAREDILADPSNAGPVGDAAGRLIPLHLDLEDFSSIQQFVDDFHGLGLPLHLLVNNAGVHLKEHKHVSMGFERTIASNFFGHFWLTQMLLPDLKANAPARIVNMASFAENYGIYGVYTWQLPWDDLRGSSLPDSGERSYTISKTFILMATRELARRLEGTGVDVLAVHPGFADSTWYLKSDDTYTFSWIANRARSMLGGWLGIGQHCRTGSISSIYASIAPELTGATSSVQSKGWGDSLARRLFGGRLVYYGPSYIMQNCFNAWPRWPTNPWVYNKSACKKLYEKSLDLVQEVERELGVQSAAYSVHTQQDGAASTARTTTNGDATVDTTAAADTVQLEGDRLPPISSDSNSADAAAFTPAAVPLVAAPAGDAVLSAVTAAAGKHNPVAAVIENGNALHA